ncbi:hypothetical protein J3E74DRAFT_478831 [Bipolaris maydis]|nr:hypothetical protein J3E74DRAFT_479203 [Bipolaris maydis]KAJ5052569.1 hypothetical protein J3E74DRAFT_478831 [Bipolaris maydis]
MADHNSPKDVIVSSDLFSETEDDFEQEIRARCHKPQDPIDVAMYPRDYPINSMATRQSTWLEDAATSDPDVYFRYLKQKILGLHARMQMMWDDAFANTTPADYTHPPHVGSQSSAANIARDLTTSPKWECMQALVGTCRLRYIVLRARVTAENMMQRLPQEIRDMIYEYVTPTDDFLIDWGHINGGLDALLWDTSVRRSFGGCLALSSRLGVIERWRCDERQLLGSAYPDYLANWYSRMRFKVDEEFVPWFLGSNPCQYGVVPTKWISNIEVRMNIYPDANPVVTRAQAYRLRLLTSIAHDNAKIIVEVCTNYQVPYFMRDGLWAALQTLFAVCKDKKNIQVKLADDVLLRIALSAGWLGSSVPLVSYYPKRNLDSRPPPFSPYPNPWVKVFVVPEREAVECYNSHICLLGEERSQFVAKSSYRRPRPQFLVILHTATNGNASSHPKPRARKRQKKMYFRSD